MLEVQYYNADGECYAILRADRPPMMINFEILEYTVVLKNGKLLKREYQ